MSEEMKFKVGDRLEAIDYHKEEYGIEYVTITSINEERKVYYWVADDTITEIVGGKHHSGYFFTEAKAYKPKTAVDWYIKQIKEARQLCDDPSMDMDIWHTLDVLIEKGNEAKEIEKQKMIDFTFNYFLDNQNGEDIEGYYNEVYGK